MEKASTSVKLHSSTEMIFGVDFHSSSLSVNSFAILENTVLNVDVGILGALWFRSHLGQSLNGS